MNTEYTKNLWVYYNNVSTYYMICVFVSITAIILSWLFHFRNVTVDAEEGKNAAVKNIQTCGDKKVDLLKLGDKQESKKFENVLPTINTKKCEEEMSSGKKVDLLESSDKKFENIFPAVTAKKQTMQKIQATLTQDQLKEEKQAEREQLAAILELLKQQEDKFQIASMEELEGQLKLYR